MIIDFFIYFENILFTYGVVELENSSTGAFGESLKEYA